MEKAVIIGSGFAGLSAACFLAKEGIEVTVIEKHHQPGGRARKFETNGFVFDMGPSWYWMPDVFERFFAQFGMHVQDQYQLLRLDPSYKVFWQDEAVNIPAEYAALRTLFESKETGAAARLDKFLEEAAYKYKTSMEKLVYKPSLSLAEFATWDVISSVFKIDMFTSIHDHVRKYFRDPKLLQLAEFPILFLGALPKNTPALYSLMNYADMKLGTWYPLGGMYEIVKAMHRLATKLGVQFRFNEAATAITTVGGEAKQVITEQHAYDADLVIAACDYHHAEGLLDADKRNYPEHYWDKKDMAPSSLLFYLGIDKKIEGLDHHNLFFDASFEQHANELYTTPQWPTDPLMYICCPSKTDKSVAPDGCENLFVLIPTAPGLHDSEDIIERYYNIAIQRLEKKLETNIAAHVIYKRSYAHSDFIADYNAFKGNAYGLANTLRQTAIMKPSIKNKKLQNLYYTGQLTVPGPGVPPSLISGEIVAKQALKKLRLQTT
ncbi:MAG: phytoene desaturase [Bacteroidetes bacterium]|nr:phytoene desaturase [Bacteroidota bacterium]